MREKKNIFAYLMQCLVFQWSVIIAERFKGDRIVKGRIDNKYESLLENVVNVSAAETTRKKNNELDNRSYGSLFTYFGNITQVGGNLGDLD